MLYIRKMLAVLLIAIMVIVFPLSTVNADTTVIYQTSTKENVTSGAMLEKIVRFTNEGWLNISVLRVDLSNKNINIDTLSNGDSIKNLTLAKVLAQSRGAIAAINGSFFNWMSEAGKGYPDGPIIESGKIITASSEYNKYNDSMASISLNNLNQIMYNYWKTDITLIAPNGQTTPVGQYNKPSRDYNDFTILDKKWGEYSIGATQTYPDIIEMVVDDGKVVEIREAQSSAQIPANGYVVITRQAGSQFIKDSFAVGDPVSFNIATNPDWNSLKMAVTGSAILVKDGQIPSQFSMNISGRHPRTAIGSSKDGSQLLLVTVDGRQNSSIGMTQYETAQLMLELGAYNALNFDGGGSTTMVTRTPGIDNLEVVNKPSDGMARGVSTAVGIFSIAPTSELDGLIVDTVDSNVFVNTSREFTVRGYDRYFNPFEVDLTNVEWSVSGVQGSFTGNAFYPKSVGNGKITATVGNVSTQFDISVLSSPVQLELSDKNLNMAPNQTRSLSVKGKNIKGYSAYIDPSDVTWNVKGIIGYFTSNTFTATVQGTGYIDASIGNTHSYCTVSVASEVKTIVDSFKQNNGSFLSYPGEVGGSYEIVNNQKYSGNSSGKLEYDFSNTEGTRAAYMVLSNGGLALQANTSKIGLWVYNTHSNSNWLRAEIRDAGGNKQLVEFSKGMDWTGWKYIETSIGGIRLPATLTRIYLVQTSPVSDSGSIYLDDLTVTMSSQPSIDVSQVPGDTTPVDEANKSVTYTKSTDSFRFSVFAQPEAPKNLLENLLAVRLTDKINNYIDAAAYVGPVQKEVTSKLKVPTIATSTGYKVNDIKNSRLIQLDASNGGLRTSGSGQWQWFLQQLDSFKGNNVFIFMTDSPQNFNDKLEANLFQEVLTKYKQKTGKNIWVFYKGNTNTSYMERGIKYITASGYNSSELTPDNAHKINYLLITVTGSSVTYELKPII